MSHLVQGLHMPLTLPMMQRPDWKEAGGHREGRAEAGNGERV